MKYRSTRGGVKDCSFESALFSGFVSDGGILLPEQYPKLDAETIKAWSTLSYVDLVKRILPLYIGTDEIPTADLNSKSSQSISFFSTWFWYM